MNRTVRAMKATGQRYFSSLTPRQKDKSVLYVAGYMAGDFTITLLPMYKQVFNPDLTKCKMFWYPEFKVWMPVNINEFKLKK